MSEIRKCDVCGEELEEIDGYFSCPYYLGWKNGKQIPITKDMDEHTSYPV